MRTADETWYEVTVTKSNGRVVTFTAGSLDDARDEMGDHMHVISHVCYRVTGGETHIKVQVDL